MGEAKRRAEKRREAAHLALVESPPQHAAQVPMIEQHVVQFTKPEMAEIRRRLEYAQTRLGWKGTIAQFLQALTLGGMDAFDQEVRAYEAHQRGESKPVNPEAEAPPERLVLEPGEVPQEQMKVLAAVSPTGYVGQRTRG